MTEGFALDRLRSQTLHLREGLIKVPQLSALFPEGVEPEFKVRQLTGEEMARCREAQSGYNKLMKLAKEAEEGLQNALINAISVYLGIAKDAPLPEDFVFRQTAFWYGMIEPALEHGDAVRIYHNWPVIGYRVSSLIIQLSELGSTLGKQPPYIAKNE